jgi:RNA polymerase sigma factor (sigma-70 family)
LVLPAPNGPDDDSRLAAAAAAGDRAAFADLYSRYESRVYNICLRITGNPDDAADATQEAFLGVLRRLREGERPVRSFAAYLFTSARHAAAKVSQRQAGVAPAEEEAPGPARDLATDPEGAALLAGLQESVRAANATLPERQREVLALRELGDLSYDEIADAMDLNRNAVSQLVWRARIGLRDALRASAVASVVAASEECERALPLIAAAEDGEPIDPADRVWLPAHLATCERCRLGKEALVEAGASYRAWLPVAPMAALAPAVMASAGKVVGADWGASAAGAPRRWVKRTLAGTAAVAAIILALVAFAGGDSEQKAPVAAAAAAAAPEPAQPEPAVDRPSERPPPAPAASRSSSVAGYSSVDADVLGALESNGGGAGAGGSGGGGLAFTGLDIGLLAAAGVALLLAGLAMRGAARRPTVSP